MIAVDTSALVAIVMNEPDAPHCIAALEQEFDVLVSAGTIAEAMIVGIACDVLDEMSRLIEALHLQVIAVSVMQARRTADIYKTWGRKNHPARLNSGDCSACDVAKEHDVPLPVIGNDFSRIDLRSVPQPQPQKQKRRPGLGGVLNRAEVCGGSLTQNRACEKAQVL